MKAQLWNGGWKFWEETDAFALAWSVPEQAREVTLPHDAMLERPARPDSPNGGDTGFRDGGSYVYTRQFQAPGEWREQTVMLRFEGVYMNSFVYLNGQLVGKRPYGYSVFQVPLNGALNYGGGNELRVLVKNSASPNSRWYTGSGICRDVWLLTGDTVFIPDFGLKAATLSISEDSAALSVSVRLENRRPQPCALTLETAIMKDGSRAASSSLPVTLSGNTGETIGQTLTVDNPALWSAEQPSLYRCAVRVLEGGELLDTAEIEFGIRTLQLDAKHGLRVNGGSVKLRGACIHHDNGLLGAVSTDAAELRRVRLLKEAGFNALRIAHTPASPALLRACDRVGMYVMDEAFDMWSRPKKDCDYSLFLDKWWREDLISMVEKDYDHPSVILYSLGNEIPEAGDPQGSALGREMARQVKAIDPFRYTMVSVNGVFSAGSDIGRIVSDVLSGSPAAADSGNVNNFMSAMGAHMDDIVLHPLISKKLDAAAAGMDALGYNYMTSRYEPDACDYPQRVMVGSETCPPEIARNWPLVERLPALIGDFTWTGWDYIGEAGVGVPAYRPGEGGFGAQFPCQLAYCGDIDITGFRRPASYFREIVFGLRKKPYITVRDPAHYGQTPIKTPWVLSDSHSTWSWRGFEGKRAEVEVYSPGAEVELLQDGVSLGRRPAGAAAGFIALFETTYRPGTLTAIAYDGDTELGRSELVSAGEAAAIAAEAESGGGGQIYVRLTLRDGAGRIVTDSDAELTVEISGGRLIGLGSGDPKPLHNYTESVTRTFFGRALAIVQKAGKTLSLTVTSDSGLSRTVIL